MARHPHRNQFSAFDAHRLVQQSAGQGNAVNGTRAVQQQQAPLQRARSGGWRWRMSREAEAHTHSLAQLSGGGVSDTDTQQCR